MKQGLQSNLLSEIDQQQDELLAQLDKLNEEIESLIDQYMLDKRQDSADTPAGRAAAA